MAMRSLTGGAAPIVHEVETNVELMNSVRESKYDFKLNELKIGECRFIECSDTKQLNIVRHSLYNHAAKERIARAETKAPARFPQREAEKDGMRGFYIFCVADTEAKATPKKKAA